MPQVDLDGRETVLPSKKQVAGRPPRCSGSTNPSVARPSADQPLASSSSSCLGLGRGPEARPMRERRGHDVDARWCWLAPSSSRSMTPGKRGQLLGHAPAARGSSLRPSAMSLAGARA
jgi:hypothetical protein